MTEMDKGNGNTPRGDLVARLAAIPGSAEAVERGGSAVQFIGHPNLIPLLRPPGLKDGFFREAELGSARPEKQ